MQAPRRWFHCPRCGSTKTARSRVRWYQAWRAAITGRHPHRCFDCRRRFWKKPAEDGWHVAFEHKS